MAGFTENILKLTEEELIFMNSVTKGPVPFGVFLKYPVWKDTEDLKEEIMGSLQKKGILNEEDYWDAKGVPGLYRYVCGGL